MENAPNNKISKGVFKILNDLSGKKAMFGEILRDDRVKIIKTHEERIQQWKSHFEKLQNCNPPMLLDNTLLTDDPTNLIRNFPGFVSEEGLSYIEVEAVVKKLQNGKSTGPEAITAEMLKSGGAIISEELHHLIGLIWKNEEIP